MVRYQVSNNNTKQGELQRLEDTANPGDNVPYNQFEENKRKFGTKSTYDFNKYTSVIDESKITEEIRAKAELVEK